MNINSTLFILNAVLNIPLSVITIVGNALVFVSLVRTPSLLSPSNVLLLSLALTDFGVGLFVQPYYFIWKFVQVAEPDRNLSMVFRVHSFFTTYLCLVSFTNVTMLSIDRFLALHLHLRYKEFVTVKRTALFLAVVWVIGAIGIAIWKYFPDDFTGIMASSILVIGQLINVVLYYNIYVILRRHRRQINSQSQGWFSTEARSFTLLKRSSINAFYLYLLFLVCYLPYSVMIALKSVLPAHVREFSWTAIFVNSCLNPLLFSWRIQEIRQAVKNTLQEAKQVLTCR